MNLIIFFFINLKTDFVFVFYNHIPISTNRRIYFIKTVYLWMLCLKGTENVF